MSHRIPAILSGFLTLVLLSAPHARAQETILTVDYYGYPPPDYPWSLELNPGVSKSAKPDGWRDFYLAATESWQPLGWFRADGGAEIHRTVDPLFVNSTELRGIVLGAFIFPTQGRYFNLYNPEFNIRFDARKFFYEGDVEDAFKTRLRFQLVGRFTVNDTTLSIGTFYIPWAIESYTDLNGDPKERAAYMWRCRAGIGYVVSGFMRAELHYIASRVRDTIEDPFTLTSRTIWLVIRNYY
jgi:hypothetical protein